MNAGVPDLVATVDISRLTYSGAGSADFRELIIHRS